ncbi:MAG TPA: BACON domain-containing carbohydrate-binding protein [Lentimicrobium sp.]|nr:BACON domain-containing carbohydrate-binding protein [Lentimicrobium sp.]
MIKSLLSILTVTLLLIVFNVTDAFAVKHVVNVQNYAFVPANLNVQVGDTIRWVWVNGSHTTTSTTIPTGAAAWDAPINSSNQVYEYRVALVGVYHYLCTPHANTQIGSFTATAPPPTLAVTPSNQNVTSSPGSTNFSVTSNSNWTASSNAGWCTVTSSGSGNGTIVANYQANTTTSQRIATITVTVAGLPSTTVTVTQAGASATLAVTPSNQNVSSTAGSTNFTVTSNSNWTASSNAGWCTVTPSGSGNGTLTATYQANNTTNQRIATITVNVSGLPSSTVTVTQAAEQATLAVTPANQNVTSAAGSTNFSVTSNSNWVASSSASWCTVTSSGAGNGTLAATYEENTTPGVRVASITVTVSGIPSSIVTVTQAALAVTLQVSPANQTVTSTAGSTTYTVLSNSAWTASSSNDWCIVTPAGNGNGTITATYEENTGVDSRVASITVIAGGVNTSIVTITQQGSGTFLAVDPLNQNVTAQAGSTTFNITSNTNWTVTSDVIWAVPITEGSGNGILEVNYEENGSVDSRIAVLSVTAQDVIQWITITQEGSVSASNIETNIVRAFPNPANGIVKITSDLKSLNTYVSLITYTGKIVKSFRITNPSSFTLDVNGLPSGNYILRLKQESKVYNLKLVVKH